MWVIDFKFGTDFSFGDCPVFKMGQTLMKFPYFDVDKIQYYV